MLQIGDVIKRLRIEKGYTQTELAIMLGLKLSTMQKYESGAILNLKVETIRELCHIFEVPPMLFIFPESLGVPIHGDVMLSSLYNEEKFNKYFKKYIRLNEKGRKKTLEYLDDIAANEKYRSEYFKY